MMPTASPIGRQPSDADAPAERFARPSPWLWFTVPIALLTALVSATGLTVPGFYRDPETWRLQAVAQDLVDLALVTPVLVASAWLAARGSRRAWLVWLGTLSYLVYTFVIYAFAVQHNRAFLAYVAVLGCSLWALMGALATTDWRAIRDRFGVQAPTRGVSAFLGVLAVLFYLLWLGEELPALWTGQPPPSLAGTGLPTNPVHVLDLTVMLPAMLLASGLLWRKRAPGYGLAPLLLVNAWFQNVAIATIMVFSIRAGLPGKPGLVAVFLALAAVCFTLLVRFLRALSAPPERASAPHPVQETHP